jgi:integrase/recombinase XerD
VFAADEFFFGKIRNEHTRAAYLHNVMRFLAWCEGQGIELQQITPKMVGQYLDAGCEKRIRP